MRASLFCLVALSFLCLTAANAETTYKYIHPKDDPNTVLTAGYITNDYPVPDGYVLEEGRPPENAAKADTAQVALTKLFDKQPAGLRAQFYVLRAAVREALEAGDTEAAVLIIQSASVPSDLQGLKKQFIDALEKEKRSGPNRNR